MEYPPAKPFQSCHRKPRELPAPPIVDSVLYTWFRLNDTFSFDSGDKRPPRISQHNSQPHHSINNHDRDQGLPRAAPSFYEPMIIVIDPMSHF